MIKLFCCRKCGNVSNTASGMVTFRAPVKIQSNGIVCLYSEDGYFDEVPDKVTEIECYECETGHMDIKEYEECPHKWEERHSSWAIFRRCTLCGAEQKGKVTYE